MVQYTITRFQTLSFIVAIVTVVSSSSSTGFNYVPVSSTKADLSASPFCQKGNMAIKVHCGVRNIYIYMYAYQSRLWGAGNKHAGIHRPYAPSWQWLYVAKSFTLKIQFVKALHVVAPALTKMNTSTIAHYTNKKQDRSVPPIHPHTSILRLT